MLHKECGWKQGESAMRKGHGRCKRRATQRACASKEGVGFPHKRGKSHLCDPPRGDDRKIYLTPTGPLMEAGSVSDLDSVFRPGMKALTAPLQQFIRMKDESRTRHLLN